MTNTFNSYIIMSKTPIQEPIEPRLDIIPDTRLLSEQDIRSSLDRNMFKLHHYCTCREGLVYNLAIHMARSNVFAQTHPYKKILVYTANTLSKDQLAWVNRLTPVRASGVLVPHSTLVSTNSIEPDHTEYIRTEFHQNNFSIPLVSFITYFTKYGGGGLIPDSDKITSDDVIKSIIKKNGYVNTKRSDKVYLGYNEIYVCLALYLNKFGVLFPYYYSFGGYGEFSSGISSFVALYNSFDNVTNLAALMREYNLSTESLGGSRKHYVDILIQQHDEEEARKREAALEAGSTEAEVGDEDESDDWDYESDDEDSEDDNDE